MKTYTKFVAEGSSSSSLALNDEQTKAHKHLLDLQSKGFPHRTEQGSIVTGIHTKVLASLGKAGKINYSNIWLKGLTTSDLKVHK